MKNVRKCNLSSLLGATKYVHHRWKKKEAEACTTGYSYIQGGKQKFLCCPLQNTHITLLSSLDEEEREMVLRNST